MSLLAITAALEALGCGDQSYATDILLGALEDEPPAPPLCPHCGPDCLEEHLRDAHGSIEGPA